MSACLLPWEEEELGTGKLEIRERVIRMRMMMIKERKELGGFVTP